MSTLNPFMSPADALVSREWYVRVADGSPVGPVSADQIARGIRAGKVPSDAQIVRGGGTRWEDILSSGAVLAALKAL
jgi:hypothetical protein